MKLYQIDDDYRGKRWYTDESKEADSVKKTWVKILMEEYPTLAEPETWITISVLKNKEEVVNALNFNNEI